VNESETLSFWSAVSQLLPVLGLALVVSAAREIRRAAEAEDRAGFRWVGGVFGIVLVLMVPVELIALQMMQSAESSTSALVSFAEVVVGAGFSSLLLTPGLALLLLLFPRLVSPMLSLRLARQKMRVRRAGSSARRAKRTMRRRIQERRKAVSELGSQVEYLLERGGFKEVAGRDDEESAEVVALVKELRARLAQETAETEWLENAQRDWEAEPDRAAPLLAELRQMERELETMALTALISIAAPEQGPARVKAPDRVVRPRARRVAGWRRAT
jgi:hypothetical protein